jgi:hypothetical protein
MHTSRVAVEFRILWLPIFQRDVNANFFVVENTTRAFARICSQLSQLLIFLIGITVVMAKRL